MCVLERERKKRGEEGYSKTWGQSRKRSCCNGPFFLSLASSRSFSLSHVHTHVCTTSQLAQSSLEPEPLSSPFLFYLSVVPSSYVFSWPFFLSCLVFFATPNCLWLAARQGKREQLAHKKYPISASDPPSQSRSAVVWRELSVLLGGSSLCRKKTGIERRLH